jgi:hypothetical protein
MGSGQNKKTAVSEIIFRHSPFCFPFNLYKPVSPLLYAGWIASVGQVSAQVPQSEHISGSIT